MAQYPQKLSRNERRAIAATAWLLFAPVAATGCGNGSEEAQADGAAGAGGVAGGGTGHAGSAGSAGSGGTGAMAGSAEGGASGAEDGAAPESVVLYTFTTGTEGFKFNDYPQPDPYVNPYAPEDVDVSDRVFEIEHGTVDSDPDTETPGSLKVTATFGEWNDVLGVEVDGPEDEYGAPLDLTDKIVTAKVRIENRMTSASGGQRLVDLYIKTGDTWAWGRNDWGTELDDPGAWVELGFDVSSPLSDDMGADYDPAEPVQLGFEFMLIEDSTAGDFGDPVETVIYVDEIRMYDKP